ncbi:hypothetical protein AAG906_040378 [Vitis piasezkii]
MPLPPCSFLNSIPLKPISPSSSLSAMNGCCGPQCDGAAHIQAVIFDLDGTLLDTEKVTKNVLKEFLEKYGKVIDREQEDTRLGISQLEAAIAVIKEYDLPLTPRQFIDEISPIYKERWPTAKPLPGVNRLMKHLQKHGVPFALASNSKKENVDAKISYHQGWKENFVAVLGSDQVKSGKPSPDLFLEAAKRMGVDAAHCLVIEDSLVGVRAANAAGMKVVAVPSQSEADYASIADSVLHSLLEFQPELWDLPPFEDWVDSALPIEPIYASGLFSNGFLCEAEDDESCTFPSQVWGLYFGWAKLNMDGIFKVLVGVGRGHCTCTAKRKIKPWIIDDSDGHIADQHMQLSLVGFIRGLNKETLMDLEEVEEEKSIASASLDLPMFLHHTRAPLFP